MALQNVALTHTVDTGRTRINEIVTLLNTVVYDSVSVNVMFGSAVTMNANNMNTFSMGANLAFVGGVNVGSVLATSNTVAFYASAKANTASNVALQANTTANFAMAAVTSAYTLANTFAGNTAAVAAGTVANAAFAAANAATSSDVITAAFAQANTALSYTLSANTYTNTTIYLLANNASNIANAAHDKANTGVRTGWVTITANATLFPTTNANTLFFANSSNIQSFTLGSSNLYFDLVTVGTTPDWYGGTFRVPAIQVDAKGRIIGASNVNIVIPDTGTATGNANWLKVAANGQITEANAVQGALQMTLLAPITGAFPILAFSPRSGTIVSANVYTDTGTSTASVYVGNSATTIVGLKDMAITSTPTNINATSNNSVVRGSSIFLDISAVSSSPVPGYLSVCLLIQPT